MAKLELRDVHKRYPVENLAEALAEGIITGHPGKPELQFSEPLRKLLSQRGISRSHVSLTDERGIASATVILECEK